MLNSSVRFSLSSPNLCKLSPLRLSLPSTKTREDRLPEGICFIHTVPLLNTLSSSFPATIVPTSVSPSNTQKNLSPNFHCAPSLSFSAMGTNGSLCAISSIQHGSACGQAQNHRLFCRSSPPVIIWRLKMLGKTCASHSFLL